MARRDHVFPAKETMPTIVVTAKRTDAEAIAKKATQGISAITVPENRWDRVDIKSVGLLPNVLARQKAKEEGAQEAIFVDADGTVMTGAATDDCAPYTLDPANPLTTELVKSGGYVPDDPADDFIEAFLKDPVFRLPAGSWAIQASAEFMGEGCALPSTHLSVTIPIVVSD